MAHTASTAISRYFESARVNIIRNLETEKYSFVLVNFEINYIDQIFYPSLLQIGSSLTRIGNKSITFTQALFINNICTLYKCTWGQSKWTYEMVYKEINYNYHYLRQ